MIKNVIVIIQIAKLHEIFCIHSYVSCIRCSRQISHKGVYDPHTTYIHLGPHFGRPVFKKCGIIPKKQYRGCGYLILPVNRLKSCKKQQNTWVWNSHLLKKCVPLIFLGQTSLINPYVYDKEKKTHLI